MKSTKRQKLDWLRKNKHMWEDIEVTPVFLDNKPAAMVRIEQIGKSMVADNLYAESSGRDMLALNIIRMVKHIRSTHDDSNVVS